MSVKSLVKTAVTTTEMVNSINKMSINSNFNISKVNIALINPEIPQNTGNIGRLCAVSNTRLIIAGKPCFSFDDKYLKRSGMDYWQHIDLMRIEEISEFENTFVKRCLSTKNHKPYVEADGSFVSNSDTDDVLKVTAFISTKGKRYYNDILNYCGEVAQSYGNSVSSAKNIELTLAFGNESSGLPKDFYAKYESSLFLIPMVGGVRSINLASSASIVLYHIYERLAFPFLP